MAGGGRREGEGERRGGRGFIFTARFVEFRDTHESPTGLPFFSLYLYVSPGFGIHVS